MNAPLKLNIGQCSTKGQKAINQDFHGALVPKASQLHLKGAAIALADGISSSEVSQIASETAIKSFLQDYYCTSDTWSVQTSGLRVIEAINGWLSAQTQKSEYRFDHDKGYVCTFSALVCKGGLAHIFHVGDSRIYRIRQNAVEQLTKDHRSWTSSKQSYLSRALGFKQHITIDYQCTDMREGDYFLLCTDGVFEYCDNEVFLQILNSHPDLDGAAKSIVDIALQNGSDDNASIQIVVIEQLPNSQNIELNADVGELAPPPLLQARQSFDGFTIIRELHASSRSHVYLVEDEQSGEKLVLKIPSVELGQDSVYKERFALEEWVARRINNAHILKAFNQKRERQYLYSVFEYVEGTPLNQWLIDNPKPDIETVRNIVEQIAKGLQAMHRLEILHQDLRPNNIMIDQNGTAKIIDFGGVRIAGIVEAQSSSDEDEMQGTALFMAPEYFIGESVSERSDQYSLAVIAYFMLSGRFPYNTQLAKARSVSAQRRLIYQSVLDVDREIPSWIDATLQKALQPFAHKRYQELSEFVFDLRNPNPKFVNRNKAPLLERKPVLFWKTVSLTLGITVLGLLIYIEKLAH